MQYDDTSTYPDEDDDDEEDEQEQTLDPQFQDPSSSTAAPPPTPLSNKEQLALLRSAYATNPHPSTAELQALATQTGRDFIKVREYMRQRRNKLRGLSEIETLAEPARAHSWLQVSYKFIPPPPASQAFPTSAPPPSVPQLSIYNAYRTRFDPFSRQTPLLGGQELIQLACATFPGCMIARDGEGGGRFLVKGLRERTPVAEKEKGQEEEGGSVRSETGKRGRGRPKGSGNKAKTGEGKGKGRDLGGDVQPEEEAEEEETDPLITVLPEPLRASSWLLSNFHTHDPSLPLPPTSVTSESLHSAYTRRFPPTPLPSSIPTPYLLPPTSDPAGETPRLLNPTELISLVQIAFPGCVPEIDAAGVFVVRGLERRVGVGRVGRERGGMGVGGAGALPFEALNIPTSSPNHPFTSLLKRKLSHLPTTPSPEKRAKPTPTEEDDLTTLQTFLSAPEQHAESDAVYGEGMEQADRELVEGLRRFRGSRLGREVRDVCVSQ